MRRLRRDYWHLPPTDGAGWRKQSPGARHPEKRKQNNPSIRPRHADMASGTSHAPTAQGMGRRPLIRPLQNEESGRRAPGVTSPRRSASLLAWTEEALGTRRQGPH